MFSSECWVKPLKDKKLNQIKYGLIKKENNFTIAFWKKWVDDNDILIYSADNEGKSLVAEMFIKALKDKIYKKMMYDESNQDKLDNRISGFEFCKQKKIM